MAQSNGQLRGAQVARTVSGNSPFIVYQPEGRAAGRQWQDTELAHGVAADTGTSTGAPKAGAWVYLNSTAVIECWPGDMAATGYDALQLRSLGLLLEDVTESTTGTNRVAIAAAVPDNIFECSIVSETATTTATTAASLMGYRFSASVNGSFFALDMTADTPTLLGTEAFQIVNIEPSEANGRLYGRVQFQVRRSVFGNNSSSEDTI